MRPLFWPESQPPISLPPHVSPPPPPPQLHLVYSKGEGGDRVLVANIHGTKAVLVPPVYSAVYSFFFEVEEEDVPPTSARLLSPLPSPHLSTSHLVTPLTGEEGPPRSSGEGGTTRVRLWLNASELVLPLRPNFPGEEGIALKGAMCAKYHNAKGHGHASLSSPSASTFHSIYPISNPNLRPNPTTSLPALSLTPPDP